MIRFSPLLRLNVRSNTPYTIPRLPLVLHRRGKCLLPHAVAVVLIKDLYILLYSYYFISTITLSMHSNSNMEVLTSNERMSAITIFSLYFDVDQNVTRPSLWRRSGIQRRHWNSFPYYIFLLDNFDFFSGMHLNAHFYIFRLTTRIFLQIYNFLSGIHCVLFYWYFILCSNHCMGHKNPTPDSTKGRDHDAGQQNLPVTAAPTIDAFVTVRPQIVFFQQNYFDEM